MSKSKRIPFLSSHLAVNDYDFWFHTRSLEETELIFDYGSKLLTDAGIHWDRVHLPGVFSWNVIEPVKGKYDWTIPDTLVKTAQKHKINILPNLWLFAAWDQKGWEGIRNTKIDDAVAMGTHWVVDDSCPIPPRYDKPHDVEAYSRWITAMVERYDGDGVDDMPGLEYPIKYWEPMNEVYSTGFWVPTPVTSHKSFAEMTKVTYLAAKKADPECKIVLAEGTERFLRAIMELGNRDGQQYFDIVNLHRGVRRGLVEFIKGINQLMNEYEIEANIWFTEFGAEFVDPPPYPRPEVQVPYGDKEIKPPYPKPSIQVIQTPPPPDFAPLGSENKPISQRQTMSEPPRPSQRRQALTLIRDLTIAFYHGVEKVFLRGFGPIRPPGVKLTEPLPESYGNYGASCLLDYEGRPRLGYYTMQLFMEKLDMFQKIGKLDLGKDVEAYKYIMDPMFNPESEFLYVLWSDAGASATLTDLENSFVTVYDTVPMSTRRFNKFQIRCIKVDGGKVKLKLSEEPIIVEP